MKNKMYAGIITHRDTIREKHTFFFFFNKTEINKHISFV